MNAGGIKKKFRTIQGGGLLFSYFSYTINHIIDIASSENIRNLT
jgi:hypothetical protein